MEARGFDSQEVNRNVTHSTSLTAQPQKKIPQMRRDISSKRNVIIMANVQTNEVNNNIPTPANDFELEIVAKATYTGYKDLFQSVYEASGVAMILALAFSAFLSSRFYATWFASLGSASLFVGGIIACGVSYFIYDLHGKSIVYRRKQKKNDPLLTVLLWGLVALSVYADLSGGAEWGAEMTGASPTDSKTTELNGIYSPQIAAINTEIDGIEAREFYWCGTHGKAHKCLSAQEYIDPKHDKDAVLEIQQLKAKRDTLQSTMNGLLADAGKQHNQATSRHYDRLESNQGAMRGAGIFAVAFALLIGYWRDGYESKALAEIMDPKRPRDEYSDDDMNEADSAIHELSKEIRALREERDAIRESLAEIERNQPPKI